MVYKNSEIAVVGAGKLAHSLVPSLLEAGYNVSLIISKNINSAKTLSFKNNIEKYSDSIDVLNFRHKIIFLTVPDGQIKKTAELISTKKLKFNLMLIVHFSGAESSAILKSLQIKGAAAASFHIMQTFPTKRKTLIKNTFAAVETGNSTAEKFLFNMAKKLSLYPFSLKEDEKTIYHLAGVFISNFLISNFYSAEKAFSNLINKVDFFSLFNPIFNSTIINIKNLGTVEALSGPVERGDLETIKNHISSIKKLKDKLLLRNYLTQSLVLLEVVKKRNSELNEGQKKLEKLLLVNLKKLE